MENAYGAALDTFPFDKTECVSCAANSARSELFACEGACGKCLRPECMADKQYNYMIGVVAAIARHNPETNFFVRPQSDADPRVVEHLEGMGFEVMRTDEPVVFPVIPAEAAQGEMDDEQFEDWKTGYEARRQEYDDEMGQINYWLGEGTAEAMVEIGGRMPVQCYRRTAKAVEPVAEPQAQTKGKTAAKAAKTPKAVKAEATVAELEAKVEQYRMQANSHAAVEIEKMMLAAQYPATPMLPIEENMMYFVMLDFLRRDHYPLAGFAPNTTPNELQTAEAVVALTPELKLLVIRDFIVENLSGHQGEGIRASAMNSLAEAHFPGEVMAIRKQCDDKVAKPIAGLLERIEAIKKKNGKPVEQGEPTKTLPQPAPVESAASPYHADSALLIPERCPGGESTEPQAA